MSDEDIEEFYRNNKEMIDRIIASRQEESGRESSEDRFRRDYIRTFEAVEGLRDAMTGFARNQAEYSEGFFDKEAERMRIRREIEADRARLRMEEARIRAREEALRAREDLYSDFDRNFGFISDPDFQKHLLGAGMELFAALGAMVQSGPFPESMKAAVKTGDITRREEFCRKNTDCRKASQESPAESGRTVQHISVVSKKE